MLRYFKLFYRSLYCILNLYYSSVILQNKYKDVRPPCAFLNSSAVSTVLEKSNNNGPSALVDTETSYQTICLYTDESFDRMFLCVDFYFFEVEVSRFF
jgi:hypothetical protein